MEIEPPKLIRAIFTVRWRCDIFEYRVTSCRFPSKQFQKKVSPIFNQPFYFIGAEVIQSHALREEVYLGCRCNTYIFLRMAGQEYFTALFPAFYCMAGEKIVLCILYSFFNSFKALVSVGDS